MLEHATPDATAVYARQFDGRLAAGHFRAAGGLQMSSVGLGTYLGEATERDDARYCHAIALALQRGCNVVDSAINYRFQRSERAIGKGLAAAIAAGHVQREAVVVATKGGFLSFDTVPPSDPSQWFHDTFVSPGIATFEDLVAGCHCMTPAYLRHEIATSLRNLQLHTIDIYYLHNPETQLSELSRDQVMARLRAAFAQLEEAVAAGQIRMYGVATWNGLRQPAGARDHLSLQALLDLAKEVAGARHHFRVVQAPYNLGMPEALTRQTQPVDGEPLSLLSAAQRLGVTVMASAAIMQGRLAQQLPARLAEALPGLENDAQRALQFVRSTPGVTTALVGMKQPDHVESNLGTARVALASEAAFASLFGTQGPETQGR